MTGSAVQSSRLGRLLTVLTVTLLLFGLTMIYSAGIVDSQKKFGTVYYYVIHQLLAGVLPSLLIYFLMMRLDYRRLRSWSLFLLIGALIGTALVFVPGIGYAVKGSYRWLDLGFTSVQPSEFLKLALIIYFAAWFSRRLSKAQGNGSLLPLFAIMGVALALIAKQPDYGTLSVIIVIIMALYFFAGAKLSHFGLALAGLALLMGILFTVSPHSLNRIKTFMNSGHDTRGISYHINQSLIGIGSGGVFGLGFGQSQQKLRFLPEPVGDSIFAIIVEELGFVGAVLLLSIFVMLVLSLIWIARRAPDDFGRFFALGLAVWISTQAFVNIAAISGLIPLTGLPLPFISFGSSSLVSLMTGLGIARNIAQQAK